MCAESAGTSSARWRSSTVHLHLLCSRLPAGWLAFWWIAHIWVLDLHPLSLESVLQQRKNARSKADYYNQHLFLRVLCHKLSDDDDNDNASMNLEDGDEDDDDDDKEEEEEEKKFKSKRTDVENLPAPSRTRFTNVEDLKANKNARNRKILHELKRGDRVDVNVSPLCIFLMRDGTVISIHKGECTPSLRRRVEGD